MAYGSINAPSADVADSAKKLETARTIQTDLGSEKAAPFDGTGNIKAGVSGVLPVEHGGTGVNSLSELTKSMGALTKVFFAGGSAPSDTKLLWIDTTANTGGLKYHNGSAWVHVPVSTT